MGQWIKFWFAKALVDVSIFAGIVLLIGVVYGLLLFYTEVWMPWRLRGRR